jgi:two-component system nitrogen regulation response regulator GlnG/two-component system response regulator HydG
MHPSTTISADTDPHSTGKPELGEIGVLVLAWSAEEPQRMGEIAVLSPGGQPQVLGRGEGETTETRVGFSRQRPGTFTPRPPLAGASLSRRQLIIAVKDDYASVERVGKCEMLVNGIPTDQALLRPGDTLQLHRQLVLLYMRREAVIPKGRYFPAPSWGDFGEPDAYGIIGESPKTWLLRERLAFVSKAATHTLVLGASGVGKELAARAIHSMSTSASRAFVARNAATLPSGLIDAELFGNARNYPNAGMAERPGLVGEAAGGTLFLDEIAELPLEQQAHLLRVLDSGEYQRLGEATTRRSEFRLVGATNRDPNSLKHDLHARFTSVVEIAPLAARREDVPLLARHLLVSAAKRSPEVAGRFVGRDAEGRPYARLRPSFIEHILHEPFETNTRQLEAVLWKAMSEAQGDEVSAPLGARTKSLPLGTTAPAERRTTQEPSADQVRAALDAAGGSVEKAARALGLSSRFAMYRLMKKHAIRD